jgi:pseudouridine-5'-monophosphatase
VRVVLKATSSHTKALELKTSNHQDWFTLFETVVTGDDPAVKAGKPAPDIFIEAARRLVHASYLPSTLIAVLR